MASSRTTRRERLISDILSDLDSRAPAGTAEDWDNVGLLIGDPQWKTRGAVVSIDLTEEAIVLAKAKGFRLIVTHHPCIFPKSRGLSRIAPPLLAFEALRHGIAVAAYHTNFDRCALEVVEAVAKGLAVEPQGRLLDEPHEALVKLVTFVPRTHLESLREALNAAGAGHIGNYDSCSFSAEGEGTFRGLKGTSPFIGKTGRLEKTAECRFETVFPRGQEKQVLSALFRTHPYEEVAYDLYAVEQSASARGITSGLGYGFWGDFKSPRAFPEVARSVKTLFKVHGFWLTTPEPRLVRRIAFVAGKGSSFLSAAASQGCDLFITGETGYHDALSGKRRGMAVMELGHRESERFYLVTMAKWISRLGLKAVELNSPTQKIF